MKCIEIMRACDFVIVIHFCLFLKRNSNCVSNSHSLVLV